VVEKFTFRAHKLPLKVLNYKITKLLRTGKLPSDTSASSFENFINIGQNIKGFSFNGKILKNIKIKIKNCVFGTNIQK